MNLIETLGHSLLMRMDAETAHAATIAALKSGLVKPHATPDPLILSTRLPVSGLILPNPVGLAAGFDKNAEVFSQMLGYGFGFVECGTVTPRPQPGNPKPRLFRLSADEAVINRMGFNNEGVGLFVRRLTAGRDRNESLGVVGANVGANKTSEGAARIADFVGGLQAVWPYCRYVAVNISSPNTPGLRGLQEKGALRELLAAVCRAAMELRQVSGLKPLFLKIAPDLDDQAIADIVDIALEAEGLTGLIVSNTTISRPETLKSARKGETGGLSGAPLFDLSTDVLKKVARLVDNRLDLIGVGGISSAETAYAKIRAGAHAVQLYSAMVYRGPDLIDEIKSGLAERLKSDGFSSVAEAVGADL